MRISAISKADGNLGTVPDLCQKFSMFAAAPPTCQLQGKSSIQATWRALIYLSNAAQKPICQ
jgi:hypothetical protein